jgi:hypothetical protein
MAREQYIVRSIQHWHIVKIDANGKETVVGITDSERDAKAQALRLEREEEHTVQTQRKTQGTGYQPDEIKLMRSPLDEAEIVLPEAERTSAMKAKLASRILAAAARSERDPNKL